MNSWSQQSAWFQEAQQLGFSVHSSTIHQVPQHGHTSLELAYLERGTLEHHINGRKYILHPGDYFIVDYGVTHSYKKLCEEKLMVRNLLFHPKFLDRSLEGSHSFEDMMNSYLLRFCYRTLRSSPTGVTFHDHDGRIGELVKNIVEEFHAKDYGYLEFVRCSFVELLILTMRKIGKKEDIPDRSPEISRMAAAIDAGFREKPDLGQFAKQLGYSVPYLSKKFSNEVGMGFTEYLQNVRLEHACRLLETTDLKISRIAAEVGYENIKHFNALFKRKLSLTPREFRALHRKY